MIAVIPVSLMAHALHADELNFEEPVRFDRATAGGRGVLGGSGPLGERRTRRAVRGPKRMKIGKEFARAGRELVSVPRAENVRAGVTQELTTGQPNRVCTGPRYLGEHRSDSRASVRYGTRFRENGHVRARIKGQLRSRPEATSSRAPAVPTHELPNLLVGGRLKAPFPLFHNETLRQAEWAQKDSCGAGDPHCQEGTSRIDEVFLRAERLHWHAGGSPNSSQKRVFHEAQSASSLRRPLDRHPA